MKQILTQHNYSSDLKKQLNEVVEEYEKGIYKSLLFHIYSGILDEEMLVELSGEIKDIFPDSHLVGTISAGEIKSAKLMDRGVLISAMLFEKTEIRKMAYNKVRGNESEIGKKICQDIDDLTDIKALEMILPGTEMNTRLVFEEVSKCNKNIKVFGGYSGGHDMAVGEHYVFDENGLTDNEIYGICYIGKDFHIDIDKSVGWRTLGHHFLVTKADENRLIEIDNAPAVEVYEKYLRINRNDNFAENTFEFPLIVKVDGDELLRHTMSVEQDGTLDLAGYVKEGMKIYLCYGDPSYIVERVNERIEEVRRFKPQAILLYSCSVRKSFWEKYVNMEMEPFEKLAITAGFHTWGEVKRNPETNSVLEYNITLLSIAMREGDAPEEEILPIKINDSVLEGQASLIKRLTTLVSATTLELQNAYANLEKMNKKLTVLSNRDSLTGLYNRRRFEEISFELSDNYYREGKKVSYIMMDLDFFKKINDTYGHAVGDSVLMEFAGILSSSVEGRRDAVTGRWGGEEFFTFLPGVEEDDAAEYAETIRKTVEDYKFTGIKGTLTVSLGVITTDGSKSTNAIFTDVDNCLYDAKKKGRNCYVQFT